MFDHPAYALIWLLVRRSGGNSSIDRPSAEQGLTIMECLVAVLLIALTIAMIAPPLVLATATRVQNRRTEQAMRVAQGEIDRLRTAVAMGLHTPANLPAIATGATAATLANVAAPTTIDTRLRSLNPTGTNCPTTRFDPNLNPANSIAATSTLPVDVDGDCVADYLVQTFRTAGLTSSAQQAPGQPRLPSEFDVGVRVYPIQAALNYTPQAALNTLILPSGPNSLGRTPAPLQLTGSNQRRRPLAVLYSKLVWAEDRTSLCSYFPQRDRQQIVSCSGSFPSTAP